MSAYTILRRADAPEYTGDAPGEFRGYGPALEAEQVAFNLRVLAPGMANVPPGHPASWGHSHSEQEEIYFVVAGEVEVKLDDDVEKLGALDAVRIGTGTVRAIRNASDSDATVALFSVKHENARADAEAHEGFWDEDF